MNIKKVLGYFWDMQEKKIEKIWQDARHPYAKAFDKILNNPLVGQRRVVPRNKKDRGIN